MFTSTPPRPAATNTRRPPCSGHPGRSPARWTTPWSSRSHSNQTRPQPSPHLMNDAPESGRPPTACDTVRSHVKSRYSHDLANLSSPMDHHEPPRTLTHRSSHEP
ncbi:hypothetical protein F511_23920 [Dorcoceras hygrometricum]|uniref:Uncharacterized protein n=1 Tax=Dorcoceras hygrometricum TaxID=472368 RepID=A0A2Z7BSI7_9LAMI|nr:hypothetical protein F511_23920 [Dorcoceras hygrometricum]